MTYTIEISPIALETFKAISDWRTRSAVMRRIEALINEPEKQGKPLKGWLSGFHSIRAGGQRYRIIYKIDTEKRNIVIHMAGIRKEGSRKDVYFLAERLVQRGLIKEEPNDYNKRD